MYFLKWFLKSAWLSEKNILTFAKLLLMCWVLVSLWINIMYKYNHSGIATAVATPGAWPAISLYKDHG